MCALLPTILTSIRSPLGLNVLGLLVTQAEPSSIPKHSTLVAAGSVRTRCIHAHLDATGMRNSLSRDENVNRSL